MDFFLILIIVLVFGGWSVGKAIGKLLSPSDDDRIQGDLHIHEHHHHYHQENHLHVSEQDLQRLSKKKDC